MKFKKLTFEDAESFKSIKSQIDNRLLDFQNIPKDKVLREVALCLLTPQSSPVSAENAIKDLENNGLFTSHITEKQVAKILRNPPGGGYVRFHQVKAKRILEFVDNLDGIKNIIFSNTFDTEFERRNTLWNSVNGFGLKEASHSLRNIGRKNLAILDRHILRCLQQYNVIGEVKTLSPKIYFDIEQKFIKFAEFNSVNIDQLDLFFWWKNTGFIYK
jgi:N-glycosylase/DNA lyase